MKLSRRPALGSLLALVCAGSVLYACGDDPGTSPDPTDSGTPVVDAAKDRTTPPQDARSDAPIADGGRDVTADAPDANLSPASQQIQAVRTAATAVTDAGTDGGAVNLPIDSAFVTYVRPAVGADPAGFFIQAEQNGPAIFVAVDPTTLTPVPVPGDEVSFKATGVLNVASLREVVTLTNFTRVSQGKALSSLLQDLTAATDVVTGLDRYESEYVKLSATVATDFVAAGAGSVGAQVTTTGITAASANLRVRLPQTVQEGLDVAAACTFTLTGPMWRFTSAAQPSGFVDADISALVCKAPKVAAAAATNLTTVVVTFDRKIAPASLLADGSQFTLNGGLTVSAAALTGPKEVTLTTSTQVSATPYTVTVAATLQDTLTKGIDATAKTANFLGYVTPAVVRLDELNPAIAGGADLIELRVVTSGNLLGITLEENLVNNKAILATLPNLAVVADDLVVVHLDGTGVTDETTSKTGCAGALCYAGAWDVKGTTGMTNNARVIVARGPDKVLQDGVAWFSSALTPSATWYLEVNALATATQWSDCAGAACANNAAALLIGADFKNVGTTAATNSFRRVAATDTNTKADWAVGASSWGVSNP